MSNPGQAIQAEAEAMLKEKMGNSVKIKSMEPVGGGCINDAYRVSTTDKDWFLKINDNRFQGMFEAELKGLELLRAPGEMCIPKPVGSGDCDDGTIFLLMEFVDEGPRRKDYWTEFGRQLARLHKSGSDLDFFGLDFDNFIGSLHQSNKKHDNWPDFFINERLEKQLELAEEKGLMSATLSAKIRDLYPGFKELFPEESPALLHGDLWGGNVMTGPAGEPCLIDPAVYYGNREVDLAFSQLFGSLPNAFYEAYHNEWPLSPGFDQRKNIYNLYPALVHVNLFGTGYLTMTEGLLRGIKP